MRRTRAGLTYTNVVATLALFLALSGGAAWAANKITSKQIGKGAVKNKNLAKNAVKAKNLAKASVTAAKLAKGAVGNAALADGSVNFAKLTAGTEVVASATAGPIPASQEGPVALNPPLSVTPVAGQLLTLHIQTQGTLTGAGMTPCEVLPVPVVNGSPVGVTELLILVSPGALPGPFGGGGVPLGGINGADRADPPGVPQSVSFFVLSVGSCTPNSTVQMSAVVTQAK